MPTGTATPTRIRVQADQLLGPEVSDADGNREQRRHAVSVFNGPSPEIRVLGSQEEEVEHVGQWVSARAKDLGKNNLFILQEDATLDEWRTLTPLLRWERSFRPSAP